jgi:hypothetical protein
MAIPERDVVILRDLAQQLAEIAALPIQQERADLWRRLNSLERVRPLVILMNGTWHENASEITLQTEDEFARGQEWSLRERLYHWHTVGDDSVYEAKIACPIAIHGTGMNIGIDTTPADHVFGARRFNDVIGDNDPTMLAMPEVSVDWEATERTFALLSELYDGILTVEKRGVAGHWFDIMDDFIMWHGIERTFTDMVDRPQWIHAWMERLTQWNLSLLDQYEALGLLELNNRNTGIGSGGLGFTDELPQPDFDGKRVRAMDQWGHATTQIFSEVSPAMHDEFALTYERRFLERFGINYYGCCEPLHRKVDIIRTLPRVRKISMSPKADIAYGAEKIGTDFVFSWKPNPTIISMEAWNGDLARAQLRDAMEKTRGCVVEILMKDLHTTRGEPWRMGAWVKVAKEVAEEYA